MLARIVVVLVLLTLPTPPRAAEEIDFGRYHALVIGNNEYRRLEHLKSAVGDAAAVAEVLRLKYGFTVTLELNATRAVILSAINGLRKTLTSKDRLLVYYSGRGRIDRETGTGYWLPVDAGPDDDTNWIANASLTRHFKAMTARHVLVVADTVYSGMLDRAVDAAPSSGTERGEWLRRKARARARTAFVSGALAPLPDEDSGGHSVFAGALIAVLSENDEILAGGDMAKQVSRRVVALAEQTPRYANMRKADHQGGDFLFVPEGLGASALGTEAAGEGGAAAGERALELAFWNSIAGSTAPAPFEAYLEQYPKGSFAPLARARVAALSAPPPAAPAPAVEIEEAEAEYIAARSANLRRSPSAGAERLATLSPGAKVAVTGKVKGADWFRVTDAEGRSGYIYAPLLIQTPDPAPPPAPSPAVPTPGDDAAEIAFWNSVKESDNPAMAEAYLKRFPEGVFAGLAKARLAELAARQAALLVPSRPSIAPPPDQSAVGSYTAALQPGESFRDCAQCPEMVVVGPGRFRMGDASGGGGADETPVHPVEMAYRFAVGRYEVTRGEFAAFVDETGYKAGGGCWYFSGQMWVVGGSRSWRDPGFRQSDRDPVACVSWHNAKAYLRWLGAKAGARYRLPSEAEWEYVARAGSAGRFPFGASGEGLCAYGNGADRDSGFEWRDRSCADGFGARTAPVGSFEPNQFGLHDTIGNLWEWVEDCWHEGYKGAPGDGGAWTTSGACDQRVVRGGSWYNEPRLMRPAFRNRIAVANRYTNLGFRPVRALDR